MLFICEEERKSKTAKRNGEAAKKYKRELKEDEGGEERKGKERRERGRREEAKKIIENRKQRR